MSRYKRASALGLVIGILGIAFALTRLGTLLTEEELAWLFKIRGTIEAPPEVVIVTIDKKTADQLDVPREISQWPRTMHARLIENLVRRGASAIVFDVAFIDTTTDEEDKALASAIARAGRVVLLEIIDHYQDESGTISRDQLSPAIDELSDAARGLAPFPMPDVPARVSKFWAFKDVGGDLPTLPAVALQVHALQVLDRFIELLKRAGFPPSGLPRDSADITSAEDLRGLMSVLHQEFKKDPRLLQHLLDILASERNEGLSASEHQLLIALSKLYGGGDAYYLNFYGPPATISTIPYHLVLAEDDKRTLSNETALAGRVVFVGTLELSTADQEDGFYTAFSRKDGIDLSGVEIAATAFANLLTGQILQPHIQLNLGILMLFGILVGIPAYLLPGMRAVVATLILGTLYLSLALFLFIEHTSWIPVFIPLLLQLPLALFVGLFCQYRSARHEQERLKPWVPDKVLHVPEPGRAFGACLLTDIQGSRRVSAELSVSDYNSLMESYYSRITQPVIANIGRVWDYAGDGMMCLFTAKKPDSGLRMHACQAALKILKEVESFNQQQNENTQLPTRIGLHAGWMELGGKTLGDVGNTVSSIEALNKQLSTKILASQSVIEGLKRQPSDAGALILQEVPGEFTQLMLRRLGSFILPGKSDPINIFELLDFRHNTGEMNQKDERNRRLCQSFAAALAVFEEQHWLESAKMFQEILSTYPDDGPAKFYLKKCREYKSNPPPPAETVSIRIEA